MNGCEQQFQCQKDSLVLLTNSLQVRFDILKNLLLTIQMQVLSSVE